MKKSCVSRCMMFLFALALLTALSVSALGEGEYRVLQTGNYGSDVLRLKERLHALGYFTGSSFNNRYTEDTAARVKAFEKSCGLPQTGVATPALQALLYSDDAVSQKNGKNVSGTVPVLSDIPSSLYRVIDADCNGDDVLAIKERLAALGFFSAKAETGNYNATLAEAIKAYQRSCQLEETGIASVALQERLFDKSSAAVTAAPQNPNTYAAVATPVPANPPAPTTTPFGPSLEIALPALNAAGFLADPTQEAYVYANRDDGHWYYISQNLYIEITRMHTPRQNITWFETEVRCTEESMPRALLAQGARDDGHNFVSPKVIGEQHSPILAISDDFYGYRWYNKLKQGVIIRNGEIKADDTYPASNKKWPYLEVLALFGDGSMRVYESDEHSAQEYLDMGVIDTFAFGPILVRDGIVDKSLYDKSNVRYTDDEPRMALGCIEPYHYIIVTAKGRTQDSDGVTMHWLAERMLALGCENALNLDGGNTVALYFMGDVLNKAVNSSSYRDISSMFGFVAN